MSQFEVTSHKDGSTALVRLKGQIDEDAQFAGFDIEGAETIKIDFQEVIAINSCGIREWIKLMKDVNQGQKIIYINCPKVIVDQINMVAGFLPSNAEVESFYVPYYSEDSGKEKMVLFTRGKEFTSSGVSAPETIKDEESGEEMELDVIESKYFKFLSAS